MPSLTDVFVAILPDTTQFGRQLQTQLRRIDAANAGKHVGGSFSSGFSGAFKGVAVGLAGAFAAVGVGALFKGFISDAAEAAKITRITENTIRSMGGVANVSAGQITSLAGSLAAKTGVDDAAIQSGANLLLTFGNVRDEVGKGNDVFTQATRLGLDMSVALGTDASGAALQLGKALNDPVKGIGALARAGVSFTAQQKEQIKTLVASGDTLGAQKIILGELEKQFGGTAAAAADPMARLSYVVGELGESLGTLLLPAVSAFATFAGEKVVPAIQGLVDGFSGGEAAAGRFAGVFAKVRAAAVTLFDGVKDSVAVFVEAFRSGGEQVTRSGFAGGLQQIGIFARDAFDYIKSDVIPAALAVGRTLREVGQGALPIAAAAFKSLFSAMTGIFNFVKANDTVFSSLAAGLVAGYVAFKVFTVVTNAFKAAQVAAMVVTTAYRAVLQAYALWTYTATGSTTAFAFALNVLKVAFLTNPIGIVVIGLVALGAALVVAYKKSETFRDIVNGAWAAVRGSVGGVVSWFTGTVLPVLQAVWRGISDDAQKMWANLQTAWDGIRTGFRVAMVGVKAVFDNVIVPVFNAYRTAGQVLWDGLKAIFAGMRTAFDVSMQGIRAVYNGVIVPLFNAYRSAAQSLWSGLQAIFNAMRSSFDSAMRGMRAVYDGVVRPTFDLFANGARGLLGIFSGVVSAIGAAWSTLRDKLRAPIKVAFDWVNSNVVGAMNSVLSKFPGGLSIPSLPRLAKGGPVKGPGGPTEDRVLARLSPGEFVVNAAAAKKFRPLLETLNKGTIRDESTVSAFSSVKRTSLSESVTRVRDDGSVVISVRTARKHRPLLEDINAGRAPTRLPGDEFGGPIGDVWGTISDAAGAVKGFAADMIAKGARKAAELVLNPLKDRLLSIIGSGNVVSAVLRGGVEKLFAAVLAKGGEKDKEMAAARKAAPAGGGGGISATPGGGSQANLVAFGRLIQSMGGRASEHPLFGGVHPVHTTNSRHYSGRAIDLNYGPGGQNATEMAFFDRILARGLPRQYGLRSIWRAPGHFNHMHVDYDRGGYLQPGAMGVNRGTRPERILTSAQTESFDRLVKVLERGQPSAAGNSSFNFNVYNPIAEPTSVTTNKALQRAADLALV